MRYVLTDRFCAGAKSKGAQTDFFDEKEVGLALRVSKHGVKAWTLVYSRADGRRARLTLGRYPVMSLAGARTKAVETKTAIASGNDPRPTGANTLRGVVDDYFRREGSKLRSVEARRSTFDRLILPVLGDRPIADIKRSEVARLRDGIIDAQGPRAAILAFAYLSKVFNWHASQGHDDDFRSPLVRGMAPAVPKARDRTLTDKEIRLVWIGANDAGTFGRLIQFLLLTAVRRTEAARMNRAELVNGLWIIPAVRMKGGLEHVVPLSAAAMALLPATGEWMFPGANGPLTSFSSSKEAFDRAVPIEPNWTLHDLRRTARSLLSRAGINADIAERCLAHTIGGVRGVYDRHQYLEEKRHAFDALAALVRSIVDPQPNVVALRP